MDSMFPTLAAAKLVKKQQAKRGKRPSGSGRAKAQSLQDFWRGSESLGLLALTVKVCFFIVHIMCWDSLIDVVPMPFSHVDGWL